MGKNDIQAAIEELRKRGWTISAIASELESPRPTVERWRNGSRYPANSGMVRRALNGLLGRKRIPKGKRYKKNPRPSE